MAFPQTTLQRTLCRLAILALFVCSNLAAYVFCFFCAVLAMTTKYIAEGGEDMSMDNSLGAVVCTALAMIVYFLIVLLFSCCKLHACAAAPAAVRSPTPRADLLPDAYVRAAAAVGEAPKEEAKGGAAGAAGEEESAHAEEQAEVETQRYVMQIRQDCKWVKMFSCYVPLAFNGVLLLTELVALACIFPSRNKEGDHRWALFKPDLIHMAEFLPLSTVLLLLSWWSLILWERQAEQQATMEAPAEDVTVTVTVEVGEEERP